MVFSSFFHPICGNMDKIYAFGKTYFIEKQRFIYAYITKDAKSGTECIFPGRYFFINQLIINMLLLKVFLPFPPSYFFLG